MIWIIAAICHFNYYNITVGIVLLLNWKLNFNLATHQVELFMWGQRGSNFLLLLLNAPLKNVSANIWFVCQAGAGRMCFFHLNATTSPSWYIYICKLRVKIDHNDVSFLPSAPSARIRKKKIVGSKIILLYKVVV